MEERLQKILAHAGVASRRKAEQLIAEGRVELNGKTVRELGTKADPRTDLIRVDGKLIAEPEDKVWFVLYKPAGCVTTLADPEGRPTIAQYLKGIPERVYPVGRLDYDSGFGFPPIAQVIDGFAVLEALNWEYSGEQGVRPAPAGPVQGRITAEGNAYLKKDFPRLDYVISTRITHVWR